MTEPTFDVFWEDLSTEVRDRYWGCAVLAVDSEAMGLLPQRDRLCLVQLCDEAGQVAMVRLRRGQKTAPNLQALMEAPHILKLFHYARFDVGALAVHLGITTQPFFCTKIASKLARTYTDRHGLKEVVREVTKIELDKTSQSSDWGSEEELSVEQLRYAANDVLHLIPVYRKLKAMLIREERLDLAEACFAFLPTLLQLDRLGYTQVFEH